MPLLERVLVSKMLFSNTELMPFNFKRMANENYLITSVTGDFEFISNENLRKLIAKDESLDIELYLKLKSKFFLISKNALGTKRALASRLHSKKSTVLNGPALHIIVVTIQCMHSCSYCQVSRKQEGDEFTISKEDLFLACDTIFESTSETLTVEFQGGDPLLRYDLVKTAIEYISEKNKLHNRLIRFVVTTTLHQLTSEMCSFFKEHQVVLSTSIDGLADLHNKNRPIANQDAYERTLEGLELARKELGQDSVSALMTTTRKSLDYPHEIVDAYVKLDFKEIFIRGLSDYGFAKKNSKRLAPTQSEFLNFYSKALERVLYWNNEGYELIEVHAAILLNKILSPFDQGYIDLQSPSGAGLGCMVYNYDGYVYPSDEARMLKETGDISLRLGKIGEPLSQLLSSNLQRNIIASSLNFNDPSCRECAYLPYCGPDPISAYNEFKMMAPPTHLTSHCKRYMGLFDLIFNKYQDSVSFRKIARRWAFSK
ncbi:His-Xaa-Ser system radical SAM maturase HxsB [Acinetobacter baumannii]|uniref:His-Xaa-Ser system radical SAM maturase HxsB n=2 Tax=Acinetobacter baumannii TaxID=470 RepID=UPI00294175EC|nr:His-Xaa-Ser system radical SAM maturase HxsB [Acinetobacter baumannii]MDV4225995.1 His-Xaa-Ser system radical SAM maturase HxsB [Acinetobacter baumannii]